MRFDFVPVRNPVTSEVGLLDRLDGTLHVSDESPFRVGTVVGSLGIGELRVEAASEAALAGFSGTVNANVRFTLDGNCTLTADTDWRRFSTLRIDGTVELAGHDLSLTDLRGTGTVSDYEVLAYVEATNAQRICTGIVPGPDTAVELDMTHLVNDNGNVLFGCDSWSTYRYMLVYASSKPYFFGEINKCCNVLTTDTRYLITLSPTTSPNGTVKFVVKHTGAAHGSFTASFTYGGNSELCLFGLGDGTRMSKYRLHSFKITKGGDLKRDFVPVRHAKTGAVALAVSSVSATEGWAGGTAYCASKGALSAACRALDRELAAKKIRVMAIEPNHVLTDMFRKGAGRMGVPESAARSPESLAQEILEMIDDRG